MFPIFPILVLDWLMWDIILLLYVNFLRELRMVVALLVSAMYLSLYKPHETRRSLYSSVSYMYVERGPKDMWQKEQTVVRIIDHVEVINQN